MKVCYVAEFNKSLTGGPQSLLNLLEKEIEKGVEPFVVCHRKAEILKNVSKKNIKTKMIPAFPYHTSIETVGTIKTWIIFQIKRILNTVNYPRVIRYLKNNEIELVHINSLLSSHVWAQAAQQCGIPYVWHIREFMRKDLNRVFLKPKDMRNLVQNASAVIAISEAIKRFGQNWLNREMDLVYNGLPCDYYFMKHNPLFHDQDIQLVMVGRIAEGKGQLDVVKALELLYEKGYENLYLRIVGYRGITEYERNIKRYIDESKVRNKVELVVFTNDVRSIREKCDIGITASVSEAFGRVTVENMLAGLVTVGADTGGTPEIIKDGETGYLYHQGSHEDLARILEDILRNQEKAINIARKGQDYALTHFSIAKTADGVYEVYRKVLSKD